MSASSRLRSLWRDVHLWIGVGLAILIVPISLSGAALVWHDDVDRLIAPSRYAVTGAQAGKELSTYLANAAAAVPGQSPVIFRWPNRDGFPLTVVTRSTTSEPGRRPSSTTVFLDPPTGNVLGTSDFGSSFIGVMHMLHGNLLVPQYSGRQIVGWVGVGMLLLCLTGIWLWWPRNNALRRAFRWKRSPDQFSNLHHMFGFWTAIPLAIVSLTGIYISFPNQARPLTSLVAPMSQNGGRPNFGAPLLESPKLTADAAVASARRANSAGELSSLSLPTSRAPVWRVQMRDDSDAVTTVEVGDANGVARVLPDTSLAGDRASRWMRWIHEGSHSPFVWAVLVFLTGILPPVFAATGIVMWLRRRRATRRIQKLKGEGLRARTAPVTVREPSEVG